MEALLVERQDGPSVMAELASAQALGSLATTPAVASKGTPSESTVSAPCVTALARVACLIRAATALVLPSGQTGLELR